MKFVFASFLLIFLTACASTSTTGSLYIENNTGLLIVAKPVFLHDHSVATAYPVFPQNGVEIANYDIVAGTESAILIQLEEIQLSQDGCEVNLDSAGIEKLTRVESPGMFIKLNTELFAHCEKPVEIDTGTEILEG